MVNILPVLLFWICAALHATSVSEDFHFEESVSCDSCIEYDRMVSLFEENALLLVKSITTLDMKSVGAAFARDLMFSSVSVDVVNRGASMLISSREVILGEIEKSEKVVDTLYRLIFYVEDAISGCVGKGTKVIDEEFLKTRKEMLKMRRRLRSRLKNLHTKYRNAKKLSLEAQETRGRSLSVLENFKSKSLEEYKFPEALRRHARYGQ